MATYDINNLPSRFANGDIINCPAQNMPYGAEKSITLPKGTYKLECWGSTGETYDSNYANNNHGGYSTGVLTVTSPQTLYLNAGICAIFTGYGHVGGYNGSVVGNNDNICSGGGATHIATVSGQLQNLSSQKSKVLLVAGGSGGEAYRSSIYKGGAGGGDTGGDGAYNFGAILYMGFGGTQTEGGNAGDNAAKGTFGKGGTGYSSSSTIAGAGGAGWYGGGGGSASKSLVGAGGGGSGYVNTSLLTSTSMASNASNNPDSTYYQGYIRITVNSVSYPFYFSASKGTGIASASASPSSGYNGETITFSATVQSGYVFDGWYDGSTKVSSSATYQYTVNGANKTFTAKGRSLGINYTATYNGQTLFTAHTDNNTVAVTYNGQTVATVSAGGKKTLHTGGKVTLAPIFIGAKKLNCAGKFFPHGNVPASLRLTNLLSVKAMSGVAQTGGVFTFGSGGTRMLSQSLPTPVVGHLYYGRVMQKVPAGGTVSDGRFEYFVTDAAGAGNIVFTSFADAIADGQWHSYSKILSFSSLSAQSGWVLRSFTVNASADMQRKEHLIIDLTATFGAGNEPTKEWLDANIPFFEDTLGDVVVAASSA